MEKTKTCTKCGVEKPICDFVKRSDRKCKFGARCKLCCNEYHREHNRKNPEKSRQYYTTYRNKNPELIKERQRKYDASETRKQKKAEWREKNPDKVINQHLNYWRDHKDEIRLQRTSRVAENKKWREDNSDILRKQRNAWLKNKLRTDPEYNFIWCLRTKIRCFLNGSKSSKTEALLGYTFKDLIKKLGRIPNPGEHLDHKIPISWFKPGTPINVIWDLSNLQIIPVSKNCKKVNLFSHPVPFDYYCLAVEWMDFSKSKYIGRRSHVA
jgi:hypothetical protein